MIDVLFISSKTPLTSAVVETVRKLHAEGARVWYGGSAAEPWLSDLAAEIDVAGVHQLPRSDLRRSSGLPHGERVWARVRSDSWLRARARTAHVLVALDEGAVYTVWQLAQRNRSAKAVFGFAPAVNAVREIARRGEAPVPRGFAPPASMVARDLGRTLRQIPASVARLLTARPVMRSALGARLWRVPLRVPGLPATVRVATGRRVAEGMRWAGRHGGASYALTLAASKVSDPEVKAELLHNAATQELNRGVSPGNIDQAVQALLTLAERMHADERYEEAARTLKKALILGFHRVTHIDQLSSPLAAAPEAFVKPFHDSPLMKAIMAPRGRARSAAPPPSDRPLRLLVTTSANDNFLHHILDRYREHRDVEVRYLDLVTQPSLKLITRSDWRVMQERMGNDGEYTRLVDDLMRPHLDWADTVFLDWCVGPAAMLTTIDPGDTRIIVRLHSYEAFTRWPHLVDFSRIDDLVFVADHVRDLTTELVPQLRGPRAPRTHVLHNAMQLSGFAREKHPEARFNLGLVGVGQVAKDPLWAVEVLRLLREEDERYRLLMVGGDMERKASRATAKYRNRMERELEPLVETGAVLRLGPTDDVAGKLVDIGFILSSSVREGSHNGLMEGAASGAVPVVRDWPFYAGKPNGASTLYPEDWVVGTPAEAAQRIRQINATEESWRENARLASKHALSTWDWSVVRHDFDRLFLGEPQ